MHLVFNLRLNVTVSEINTVCVFSFKFYLTHFWQLCNPNKMVI